MPNPLRGGQYYWVPVGLLEDAPFKIHAHLFVSAKAQWDVIASEGTQYETMPEWDRLLNILAAAGHA